MTNWPDIERVDMCRTIMIEAKDDDGSTYPGTELIEFEPSEATESCTCWLGTDDRVYAEFMKALRPYLKAVSYGQIIIRFQ